MANPFENNDDADSGEILEGFLCPICREDLKSFEFLTEHFERVHAEEEDALKSIIKDMFTKAKRKIKMNFDDSSDIAKGLEKNLHVTNPKNSSTQMNVFNFMDNQEVGIERSHFTYFESVRNPRLERFANETNKLIIRLHKMLKDMPTDPVLRKQHEQNVVTWLDGSSVKLCPNCAKSFHIARRQHHCRLCGSIICHDCSQFLSIENALTLASLSMSQNDSQETRITSSIEGIRCCDPCLRLLETRMEMHESRTSQPPIIAYYTEIQQLRKDITPDIEMYMKIVDSLYSGETIFTIADASALRGKIGQFAEAIDLRSKRILALHCEQGSRTEALQKSVRLSCIQFIKEKMLAIPPLPAEDEIHKIQERKRMETEMRIETERRQALEAYEKYGLGVTNDSSNGSGNSYASGSALQSLDNWSAYQISAASVSTSDDPLVQQINIVKGYIKQARQDMCYDAVETLELNLRELYRELYRKQSATQEAQTAVAPNSTQ